MGGKTGKQEGGRNAGCELVDAAVECGYRTVPCPIDRCYRFLCYLQRPSIVLEHGIVVDDNGGPSETHPAFLTNCCVMWMMR